MPVQLDHAVIIGGSVGGMTAAKVLSGYSKRVTVVERDELINDVKSRRPGAPQSPQTHGLLMAGTNALDKLYGGRFSEKMRAEGCADFDAGEQFLALELDGWARRPRTGMRQLSATRVFIERVIRELTLGDASNVELRRAQVRKLVASEDGSRVVGVELRDEATGETETITDADLVVDASGRGTKSPKWLQSLGFEPPVASFVRPFLGYATVHAKLSEDLWPGEIRQIDIPPVLGLNTRGGNIVQEENGIVGFTAHGIAGDYPPDDLEGFIEFLRGAMSPLLYDMFKLAEPITDPIPTQTSANRMYRWHELERRAAGFVAIGDTVVAMDPFYGQGMSNAILHASLIGELLADSSTLDAAVDRFPIDAFSKVSKAPWEIAITGDLEWPSTEVENMPDLEGGEDMSSYFRAVRRLAVDDDEVAETLIKAVHLFRPDLLDSPELHAKVEAAGELTYGMPDGIPLPPDVEAAMIANGATAAPVSD